jgi:probable phosphoglycerate mutase
MNELWLIRHGETEWSAVKRHTGRTDIPLTPAGEREAAALGQSLAGRRFALMLCSPLRRARETCRLAGYGDVANVTDDLLEWDYGI